MKPAAIQGVYADLKTIKSRSTVQIIIECPIERGAEIVEAFGFPQPAGEVHVVVARLALEREQETPHPERGKREFASLPAPQQAALACKSEAFQRFLHEEYGGPDISEETAAKAVRRLCGVDSRAQLTRPQAEQKWTELHAQFRGWLQVPA